MSIKPNGVVKWAESDAFETRQGGPNKIEPTEQLKQNGSLDGNYSLNHLNFMFNLLGQWTQFTNDSIESTNGGGQNLTKDGHCSFIFAFDSSNLDNFVLGFADKPSENAATTKILQSNTLSFGTPLDNGSVPIAGADINNVKAFSLNFKIN